MKQCFTKVSQCCEALSSLVVTYRNGELKSNIMESITAYLKAYRSTARDELDGSDIGRFTNLSMSIAKREDLFSTLKSTLSFGTLESTVKVLITAAKKIIQSATWRGPTDLGVK